MKTKPSLATPQTSSGQHPEARQQDPGHETEEEKEGGEDNDNEEEEERMERNGCGGDGRIPGEERLVVKDKEEGSGREE